MSIRLAIYNALSPMLPARGFFGLRRAWLRFSGLQIGRNCRIASGTRFYDRYIALGDDTWIGFDVTVHSTPKGPIRIGARVDVADRACIISGTHALGNWARRAGAGQGGAIDIGDGTWVGANVTIIAGAQIGAGSVVAAGAVVVAGRYPDDVLLAGVPARLKCCLEGGSRVPETREGLACS